MRGPKITCKTPEIYYLNLGIQTKTPFKRPWHCLNKTGLVGTQFSGS